MYTLCTFQKQEKKGEKESGSTGQYDLIGTLDIAGFPKLKTEMYEKVLKKLFDNSEEKQFDIHVFVKLPS